MSIPIDRDPVARAVALGEWSFEVRNGEIAALTYRGRSVLRMVRFVVRDQDWRTVPAKVRSVERGVISPDTERVSIGMDFDAWGIRMSATITVRLEDDSLRIDAEGLAESEFLRNRIGLVVLHHPDDAGSTARVTDVSNKVTTGSFPSEISPHQPFRGISDFHWSRQGAEIALAFEGDVFEMEDQRNWTDASFKTYSTPLSEPFPVLVRFGDVVRQSVTIRVSRADDTLATTDSTVRAASPRVLAPTPAGTVMPPIGTLLEPGHGVGSLAGWPLGFLQVEIDLAGADAASDLDRAVSDAQELGLPLDLRVLGDANSNSTEADLAHLVGRVPVGSLVRLAVFDRATHVAEQPLRDAAARVAAARGDTVVLVGTRAHFTELNRAAERLSMMGNPVAFSLTPTMHTYEIAHVRDSLSTHAAIIAQAAELVGMNSGDATLHVGPITLEARFNAVATRAHPPLEPTIDDHGLYAHPMIPGWVFATVVQLAGPATESISILRASGYRGLVDNASRSPTSAGLVVRRLAELAGTPIHSRYRDAEVIAAVVGDRLFVANLTDHATIVELEFGPLTRVISLAAHGFAESTVS